MSWKRHLYEEAGVEPKKALLRRMDIIKWTGIKPADFDCIASADPVILPWKVLKPRGKRYYRKQDVIKIFFRHFKGD